MTRLLPLLLLPACLAATVARVDGTLLPASSKDSLYFVLPIEPPAAASVVTSRGPRPRSNASKCWCDLPQLGCTVSEGEVRASWTLAQPSDLPVQGGRAGACTDGTSSWWVRTVHTRPAPDPWWRSESELVVPTRSDEPSTRVVLAPAWLPEDARVAPAPEGGPLHCKLREQPRAIEVQITGPVTATRDGQPCLFWHGGEVRAYPLVWLPLDDRRPEPAPW